MLRLSTRPVPGLLPAKKASGAPTSVYIFENNAAFYASVHARKERAGSSWPREPQETNYHAPAVVMSECARSLHTTSAGTQAAWSSNAPTLRTPRYEPSLESEPLQDQSEDFKSDEDTARPLTERRPPVSKRRARKKQSSAQNAARHEQRSLDDAAASNLDLHKDLDRALTSSHILRAVAIFNTLRERRDLRTQEIGDVLHLLKTSTVHTQFVEMVMSSYQQGEIAPDNEITNAIIEYLLHHSHEKLVDFINWALKQKSPKYCSWVTYGYAIRVYSKQGRELSVCERLFKEGQKRFCSRSDQASLKPSAGLQNLLENISLSQAQARLLLEMARAQRIWSIRFISMTQWF